MNTGFSDLDFIALAARWDTAGDATMLREYAAQEAYQNQPMTELNPKPIRVDPIVAGVQSCMLANHALQIVWGEPDSVDARLVVAAAHAVLATWGIDISSEPLAPEEVPAPPEATLVWPPVDRLGRPLSTTLPDVYRENYYHVREAIVVTNRDAMSGISVAPEHPLVLKDAYWNEESLQWRMQFTCWSLPQTEPFWVDHCKVMVGDEIP